MDNIAKKRCIIITSYNDAALKESVCFRPDDYIICADGGYALAKAEGIVPNLAVGDFDSFTGTIPANVETVRTSAEKDDTDTMLCMKIGLSKGFEEFIICGGIGGRLDHTFANLQTLAFAADMGKRVWILSGRDRITMLTGGRLELKSGHRLKEQGYKFSLFSFSEECTGIFIRGAYYPLTDATLKNNTPLGVSNEFLEDVVTIENRTGNLLVILSKE